MNEFAANITRHQGVPAALLIGLDGGAALLNHTRPLRMRDELLQNSPTTSSAKFNQHALGAAWRKLTADERQQFMLRHTGPDDLSGPDARAIDCIAHMIDDRHLQAVIVTDSNLVMYDELLGRSIKMSAICGSGSTAKTLTSRKGGLTLIDGGDLLLKGLWPNMYGYSQPEVHELQKGLAEFLSSFEYIYCWGWCDFNVDIKDICPERSAPRFTALGRYTSDYVNFPDIDIVDDGSESDDASNDILYELASNLFRTRPARSTARANIARSELAGPPTQEPRFLLTEAAKADLFDQVDRAVVSFIGVEGELTRERCAEWLSASWQAEGRQPLVYASDNVGSLVCWVFVAHDLAGPTWLIGRLVGDAAARPDWASILLPHVLHWLDGGSPAAGEQRHVVLCVPPAVAQWAVRAFGQRSSLWAQSYFADTFLAEGAVVEWLIKNVGPLLPGGLDRGALPLARHIVGTSHHPGDADWLHGALDSWYRDILHAEGRRAEAAVSEGNGAEVPELRLEDLFELWDQLCCRCDEVDRVQGVDFDIDPVQSLEQDGASAGAANMPEFNIDVTPRSPTEPADQQDAGPGEQLPTESAAQPDPAQPTQPEEEA